jgi:hypothetical protein
MSIQPDILSWLTHCPAGDDNFRANLDRANSETLREALEHRLSLTATRRIEARLRRLRRLGKEGR